MKLHPLGSLSLFSLFLLGLSLSFSLISAADTFSDVESGHDNYIAIEYLVSSGTLEGYSDGTFLPEKEVNRAELMKMLVAGQEISPDESLYKNCFSDVTTDWYAKYVCYAKEGGWVNGYSDGTFKPANTVNKVEALKMIIQAYGYGDRLPDETGTAEALFSDFDSSQWYAAYVQFAVDFNLLEESGGALSPEGERDRGSVAENIFRTLVVQYSDSTYSETQRDGFLESEGLEELITAGSLPSALEDYHSLDLVQSIEATPNDNYSGGAFCRLYDLEDSDELLFTYGTGQGSTPAADEDYVGGGEGGQGSVYNHYTTDLEETGEHGYYTYGGGDLATTMGDGYFYHLTGGTLGWKLLKFDLSTWEEVDSLDIELDDDMGANDEMLSYTNGMLFASGVYGDGANGADVEEATEGSADPTVGVATHNHSYTTDLTVVDEWILDDVLHNTGSSLVFVDGVYNYVSSTAFFGDLMVMQYDEDWNYLASKSLIEGAQWPQGTVYDEESERFYVAYLSIEGAARSEVSLAVFDSDWELLSNTVVTDYGDDYFGGRPSVMLHDGYAYVTYDKESRDAETKELQRDWQCQMSVYEMME